jgi:Protein of unknown function (DUF732)
VKKVIAAIGIALAAVTGALGAPTASATPSSFLNAAQAQGFWHTGGNAGLLQNGYWACNQIDSGWTPAATVSALSAGSGTGYMSNDSAMAFAAMAIVHLCPWNTGLDWFERGGSAGLYA